MNKGEPLKINIKARQGTFNKDKFEFFPKAKTVAKKKPNSNAKIAKYIFQIIPEPINTNCSQSVISAFGKSLSPYPIDLRP